MDHGVVIGGGESSEHSDSEPSSTSEEFLCIGLESSDENLMDKADSESEDAPSDGISLAPSSEALRNWTGSSQPDRHFAGRTAATAGSAPRWPSHLSAPGCAPLHVSHGGRLYAPCSRRAVGQGDGHRDHFPGHPMQWLHHRHWAWRAPALRMRLRRMHGRRFAFLATTAGRL